MVFYHIAITNLFAEGLLAHRERDDFIKYYFGGPAIESVEQIFFTQDLLTMSDIGTPIIFILRITPSTRE